MRSSFGARRKARKIGQDEEDEGGDVKMSGAVEDGEEEPPTTVIRPASTSRSSSKAKRKPIRASLGPGGTSMNEDDEEEGSTAVFTPKKSNLARQALEKNALRKSLAASIQSDQTPLRQPEDRPSYTADALNKLKSSTPSTPKDLRSQTDIAPVDPQSKELDLAAKFGSNLAFHSNPSIPTDAEIREKKDRRARLAKEHEFITLNSDGEEEGGEGDHGANGSDSDDSTNNNAAGSILPYAAPNHGAKHEATRLVPDDEDIAEGFDAFVEDGRIALGRKAEKAQKLRQEAEMREMIARAEGHGGEGSDGGSGSEEDASETERNAAYEAAQTRKGMDGLRREREGVERAGRKAGMRTPPRITPLPSLAGVVERLKGEVARKEAVREGRRRRLEEVRGELREVEGRKGEVQRLLDEAGERYRALRMGGAGKVDGGEEVEVKDDGGEAKIEGGEVKAEDGDGSDDDDDDDDDDDGDGRDITGGLGSGLGSREGLGSSGGTMQEMLAAQLDVESEWT